MTSLQLGVLDVPYDYKGAEGKTTGDVAEILEDMYGIMGFFFEAHKDEIIGFLSDVLQMRMEAQLRGDPVPPEDTAFHGAETKIAALFQVFLDRQEMDGQVPGVPTNASLQGIRHRFKHPYAKGNPPRPSFVDTGTYQSHFAAWLESN